MKIQFLGTAAGDFPRLDNLEDKFAYLPRARELGGRNLRRPAQAVIFPDILIDFYDSRQLDCFGIAKESIKCLFVTHAHWDHCRPRGILEFAAELPHQLQVYGNRCVIDALKFADSYDFDSGNGRFTPRSGRADIGYHVLEPEQIAMVDDTTVAAVHANHGIDKSDNMLMDLACLNFVFERDGKAVFYGLDSSYPLPLTVDFLRRYRLDAAVFDATFGQWPIDVAKSGHHNLAMLIETTGEFRDAGIIDDESILLASHIALAEVKPHDDLVGDFVEAGITLAYDGLIIDV